MNYLDFLGHLFYLTLFTGNVMITKKHEIGWLLRLLGEAGWMAIGLAMGMTSIWMWSIPFIIVDGKGYISWRQAKKIK